MNSITLVDIVRNNKVYIKLHFIENKKMSCFGGLRKLIFILEI